jgi:hypothetical protein
MKLIIKSLICCDRFLTVRHRDGKLRSVEPTRPCHPVTGCSGELRPERENGEALLCVLERRSPRDAILIPMLQLRPRGSTMHTAPPTDPRTSEIGRILETEKDIELLQQHLKEVIEGAGFKASQRGGQFLKYIVDQAIAGHFESLKERVIGIELFGRSPTYDTGEDAIVRVTASDVRKRLLQHYGTYGATSEFHISLPLGSYIPEITRRTPSSGNGNAHAGGTAAEPDRGADPPRPDLLPAPVQPSLVQPPIINRVAVEASSRRLPARIPRLPFIAALCTLVLVASVAIAWNHYSVVGVVPRSSLLWSAFFRSPHSTQIITSDPNIAEIEGFTGGQLSVSDYANHNYIPDPSKLTQEVITFCRVILRGDKAAALDTPIAVYVGQMALASSRTVSVHAARSIQIDDLATNDNFVFIGSPRTNPWSALFSDQLDFRFVFDEKAKTEFIRNVRPRSQEASAYAPTAPGWATGRSFATIAMVKNPDQVGQVLLIAGATGEGTEAAGRFITETPRLNATLEKCGVTKSGAVQHWQLLLQLNAIAGAPNNVDVVACHLLDASQNR